jgi:LysR family positive regulator for ilvC
VLEGSLRLYCSVTASYSFLYDILARFRQLHPKVAITVSTGDPAAAIERVRTGLDDFAIAAHYPGFPSQLSFKPIATTPLILIAPLGELGPSAQASPDSGQRLMEAPLILPEQGPARRRFDRYCHERGLAPRLYAEAAGNEAIVSMVSLGFGVGLVPQLVLENSPLRNRVQVWNHPLPLDDLVVGLCVLDKRLQQPVIQAFWSGLSP